jgi:hypothetical protein
MAGGVEQAGPAASSQVRAFCRRCGYALVGLPGRVCPECGGEFDLSDPRTFARRPPRGWVRTWSLRIGVPILLVAVFAAGGLGWLWLGWHVGQPTIGQLTMCRATVDTTQIGPERLGTILGNRLGYLRDRITGVRVDGMKAKELTKMDFGSLGSLEKLSLFNGEFDQRVLVNIGQAKGLKYLNLGFAKIKTPDLSFLRNLRALESLSLWCVELDDDALSNLEGAKKLKTLNLDMTHAGNAGLEHLRQLLAMEELHLEDTRITDAGLEYLKNLKSLREIWIKGTRVSQEGIAGLKRAIPGVVVHEEHPKADVGDPIFNP